MQKGGIYNHFPSKEDLAMQALDYATEQISQQFAVALKTTSNAADRLMAVILVMRDYAAHNPIAGGCPIMNCAMECDDIESPLLDKARQAMDRFRNMFVRIVAKGIAEGDFKAHIHPDTVATLFVANFEGALMLSNLYKDTIHMNRAMDHLAAYVEKELLVKKRK